MTSFTRKQQIAILILGILLVFILGTWLNFGEESKVDTRFKELELENIEEGRDEPKSEDSKSEELEKKEEKIAVTIYIKGAVKYPGILTVEQNSRVADAIEAAGGPDEGADFDNVNLARKVQDEEMIHIPYQGEEIATIEKSDSVTATETKDQGNGLGIKVDINTASKEELKTLSGIGDVTAQKIMSFREENTFKAIEDIMNVSGVGEKKFEAIKDSIAVD